MSTISLLKHGFFSKSSNSLDDFSYKEDDFNLNQLKSEFSTLYQIVNSNKHLLKSDSGIVQYCNWLCDELIRYYSCDYVADDLQVLIQKKQKIAEIFQKDLAFEFQNLAPQFRSFLTDKIKNDAKKFIYSLKSSSKIRSYISILIVNRTYWNYSRSLARFATLCLLQTNLSELIQKINKIIGPYCSPEYLLQLLEIPREILRASSFSLYALRIIINILMVAKHLILAAISTELSTKKVLIQEIEKRAYITASDMGWCIVNLLTNYYQFFGLTLRIVSHLNLAFFAVDILLFLAIWLYEKNEYNQRIMELEKQKYLLESPLELALINRQIDILNDEWEAQCAYYMFNIAAALLFVVVFGATLVCSGPFLLLGMAALSMMANALYNSCEEYKLYKQASIAIKRELLNGSLAEDDQHYLRLAELNSICDHIYADFWKTLVFNAGFTSFIIIAAAISWPLAALITISYLGYKLWESYEKEQQKKGKKEDGDIYRLLTVTQVKSLAQIEELEPIHQHNDTHF
ncbi:MAG: hypothetical protein H0T84_15165 [Tatlockia sp.]|nr:hypothetical protein [Tatlockia sp.]